MLFCVVAFFSWKNADRDRWKEKKEKESRKLEEKWDGEVVTTPARNACSLLHYHSEKSGYSAYRLAQFAEAPLLWHSYSMLFSSSFNPPLRYMYRRMRKCMVHIPKIQTTQTDVVSYLVHCVTRCTSQYITTPKTRFFCYSFYIYSPVAISSFILAIAAAGLRPLGHVRVHYAIVSMISNAQCQYAYVEDGVASVKRHGVLHLLLSLGAVRILLVRLC